MIFLKLFFEFFKTGLFSVGGGLATLPFLYNMSEKTGWFSPAELADMVAVSESTPGPIGVNMATYVGFSTAGIPGAIIATVGLATPSVIVILCIAKILEKFRKNKYVDQVFYGLRPCSVALIAAAGVLVLKISLLNIELFNTTKKIGTLVNIKAIILAMLLLLLTRKIKYTKKLHPIIFILFSAIVGIVFGF